MQAKSRRSVSGKGLAITGAIRVLGTLTLGLGVRHWAGDKSPGSWRIARPVAW